MNISSDKFYCLLQKNLSMFTVLQMCESKY